MFVHVLRKFQHTNIISYEIIIQTHTKNIAVLLIAIENSGNILH